MTTIGLISLASISDNELRFRDIRRTHASFIRKADNFTNKSEYAWLNAIIYLYIAQKKMEFHRISKIDHQGQFYYNTNNNSTSMAEPWYISLDGSKIYVAHCSPTCIVAE